VSSNDGVFLYVGIVAIWAGFLIPAWIRRPHASDLDAEADVDPDAQGGDQRGEPAAHVAEWESEETGAKTTGPANSDMGRPEFDSHRAPPRPEYREHVPDYGETARWPDGEPVASQSTTVGQPAADGRSPAAGPSSADGPSQGRQQMLRARRRMLTILVSLSLVTSSFVVLGLVRWWICVPPIGMLALYVLLLREIAMADIELASKRAAWARAAHARAVRDEQVARQRRHAEWAAAAEPSAEIIDISDRVGDQLYDQYADAAVRAVGD